MNALDTVRESATVVRDIPDFLGRMKAIWGDKLFPEGYMTQAIREDRDARLAGAAASMGLAVIPTRS